MGEFISPEAIQPLSKFAQANLMRKQANLLKRNKNSHQ